MMPFKQREARNTYSNAYYEAHKMALRPSRRRSVTKHTNKVKEFWRNGISGAQLRKEEFEFADRSEKLANDVVLGREGFTEIVWLRNHHATFDFLALKAEEKCSIDVTVASAKNYSQSSKGNNAALKWLEKFVDLKHYILFISPDLSRYVLRYIPVDKRGAKLGLNDVTRAKLIPEKIGVSPITD